MPAVTCPGCQKKYNLPESAAGQVASCKCGKRFRVGGASAPAAASQTPAAAKALAAGKSAPAAARPQSAVATAGASAKAATAAAPAAKPSAAAAPVKSLAPSAPSKKDNFWDDALPAPARPAPAAAKPAAKVGAAAAALPDRRKRPDAPPPKQKKVRWGFDWGKVGGGLLTLVVAGGITAALLFSTGRIYLWPAIIAVGGLFTALSGLMGEEGVW
jgi:hypothetical protein